MLSGFAWGDCWFPGHLDLTVPHEKPEDPALAGFRYLTHLNFLLRWKPAMESQSSVFCLGWSRGVGFCVCMCVYVCTCKCAHLESETRSQCAIKQGTDGAVSSRHAVPFLRHIPQQCCICKPKLPAIPRILKFPELREAYCTAFLWTIKITWLSAFPLRSFPLHCSLGLVGDELQTKILWNQGL